MHRDKALSYHPTYTQKCDIEILGHSLIKMKKLKVIRIIIKKVRQLRANRDSFYKHKSFSSYSTGTDYGQCINVRTE